MSISLNHLNKLTIQNHIILAYCSIKRYFRALSRDGLFDTDAAKQ